MTNLFKLISIITFAFIFILFLFAPVFITFNICQLAFYSFGVIISFTVFFNFLKNN